MTAGGSQRSPYRVYVSSTYEDQKARRQAVLQAIRMAGMDAVGMEDYGAVRETDVERCTRDAAGSDVLVAILAWRYGWIPPGREVSITELEIDSQPERLVFLVDEDQEMVPSLGLDRDDPDGSKFARLVRLKARLRAGAAVFTDAMLAAKVCDSLERWRDRKEGRPASRPPEADALETYRHLALQKHEEAPLLGFPEVRFRSLLADLHVEADAYVDLRQEGASEFGSFEEMHSAVGGRGQSIVLRDAFREADRCRRRGIVLLGEPGAGKTTHLKHVLATVLREGPESVGLPADTLPVYLELAAFRDIPAGFEAFVRASLEADHPSLGVEFAQRLLRRPHLLLLLDGLDELADPDHRKEVCAAIKAAARELEDARILVTCRYAGYEHRHRLSPDFLELHLRPLSPEQSERFVRRWFDAVERQLETDEHRAVDEAERKADALVKRFADPDMRSQRIAELRGNPLLLGATCLVYRRHGELPSRRVELYRLCLDILLERAGMRDGWPDLTKDQVKRVLASLALWMHEREKKRAPAAEIEPVLATALGRCGADGTAAHAVLEAARRQSGVLTGWSGELFGFLHLGFQEYLAAVELHARWASSPASLSEGLSGAPRLADSPWWEEVLLLLVGLEPPALFDEVMAALLGAAGALRYEKLLRYAVEDGTGRSPRPFEDLLALDPATEPDLGERQALARNLLETLQGRSRRVSGSGRGVLPPLSGSGVGRVVVTAERGGVAFVRIPAGSFVMGSPRSEVGRDSDEYQHPVELSAYLLSTTPVTNEQYRRYLTATGAREPEYWGDRQFNQPDQPVVGVSWEEAMAFCRWIGGTLPTEAQWEYACRARTSGAYSCDAESLDEHAWFDRNSGGRLHPIGEKLPNPWGLFDMHGNVWEWCSDWFGKYPKSKRGAKDPTGPRRGSVRVVRGGGFRFTAVWLRSAFRIRFVPGDRWFDLGFRVALSPPRAESGIEG